MRLVGLKRLLEKTPALCAMIHVPALPATPRSRQSMDQIISTVAAEARLLALSGVDAIMIENMHDTPYVLRNVGPEIVAAMTACGLAVRAAAPEVPTGVQVLAGANREALAVALACGMDFVRVEGFVFGHVGDEGYHDACAGELLRYRRQIGAEHISIIADIKKKHSAHAVTADVSLGETAHAAEFFGADGVIVTGTATGVAANPADLAEVRRSTSIRVAIGSGITPENAHEFRDADIFIVGSYYKRRGAWDQPPDRARLEVLVKAVRALQKAPPR